MAYAYLLETGTDRFLLEDGSLLLLDDDVLDQAQTSDSGVASAVEGSTSLPAAVGQSFTTVGTQILRVEVMVYTHGAPADTLSVEIQTDAAGVPSGAVVGSTIDIAAAGVPATVGTWLIAAVNASVTAATTYWIVVRRSAGPDSTNAYYAQRGSGNPYANGTLFYYNGSSSTWTQLGAGGFDLMFRIWTAAITMSLPDWRIPRRRSLDRTRV